MGQREARGAFEDRVEVVGGVGMHISPEKKCDFANHPRTRAHGCLNRLFPLLIVVSSTRGVNRGVGKRGGIGSYVYCGVWRVLLFVILGSRIITFFFYLVHM